MKMEELLPLKMHPFTLRHDNLYIAHILEISKDCYLLLSKQDLLQGQDSSPDSALPIT